MSKISADIGLLSQSVGVLNEIKNIHDPSVITSVENNNTSIQDIGALHDNCFSNISTSEITSFFDKTSTNIDDLSGKVNYSIDKVSDYTNDETESFDFDGKSYLITNVEVKGQDSFLDMFYDPNIPLSEKIAKANLLEMYKNGTLDSEYDYQEYNKMLLDVINKSPSQREKVVNMAIFMSTVYPNLPYLLGGGHYPQDNVVGIDPKWGTSDINEKSKYAVDDDERDNYISYDAYDSDHPERLYSLDCSGYVTWALRNAGLSDEKLIQDASDCYYVETFGASDLFNENVIAKLQPGDLVRELGHIGIVVDKEGSVITVSHVCGNAGMDLSKIDLANEGLIVEDARKPQLVETPHYMFNQAIFVDYDD